jgi:hypothetical protein
MLHPLKTPTAEDLRKNILSTYYLLRMGIVVIAAALPTALLIYTFVYHGGLEQGSISAFYGAYDGAMRNWFVGSLCAIGAFLILYKGFSFKEDMALNIAGTAAILIAITPCECWTDATLPKSWLHTIFAIAFFASMAFVCFTCALETIDLLPQEDRRRLRRAYFWIGLALVASPGISLVLDTFLAEIQHALQTSRGSGFVFAFEAIGVWVFAFYWYTKTQEYEISSAENEALKGHLDYDETTRRLRHSVHLGNLA